MADDIVQRLVPYFHDEQRMPAGMIRDVMDEIERLRDELAAWQATVRAHDALAVERADEIERLRSIGKSHYGPHHDPMWCPICDRAWPCPTWIQFFGEEAHRGTV